MEIVFDVVKYAVLGFFALLGGLFVLALVFGKRIERKWDYEAKFRDARGRELGEFEIELSRIVKEQTDFTLEVKLDLRHPALERGRLVEVHLDDVLLMQGPVLQEGRIRLRGEHLVAEVKSPAAGQVCAVLCDGEELCAERLDAD